MQNKIDNKIPKNVARILMFSQRNIYSKYNYRCALYEFEDLICNIDAVDLINPYPNKYFKYGSNIAQRLARDYAVIVNPGIKRFKIYREYDLFLAICQFPKDLLHLNGLKGWKNYCKTSICWLDEIWLSYFKKCRAYIKILSEFDHIIINTSQSLNKMKNILENKCNYLPLGIDSILFCPYPNVPQRVIDVYSIGRKSERTHHALLKLAKEKNIFYMFDSIIGNQVRNSTQHRFLFANTLKRSRYFLVNPGKINETDETSKQSEFGSRYIEGIASGTILVGATPDNEEFKKYFYWKDAVINLPYDSEIINELIKDLDNDLCRQNIIRKNNVIQSLNNHDWVYRYEKILNLSGMDPMPELLERKKKLAEISMRIENNDHILG